MAVYTVLNRNSYPAGHHSYGPVAVPVGTTELILRMARFDRKPNGSLRDEWGEIRDALDNPQDVVRFAVEISQDAGATWRPLVGGTAHGGILLDKNGDPAEFSVVRVLVPQPDNADRRVRGYLDTYTTLGTVVEVETLP